MTRASNPWSISFVGRRVLPCNEWTVSPVRRSTVSGTFLPASSVPLSPCSGANSATSFTPVARRSTSIVLSPRRLVPAGWVNRPMRLPRTAAKPSLSNTSIPGITGNTGSGGGAGAGAGRCTTAGAGGVGLASGEERRSADEQPGNPASSGRMVAKADHTQTRGSAAMSLATLAGTAPSSSRNRGAALRFTALPERSAPAVRAPPAGPVRRGSQTA